MTAPRRTASSSANLRIIADEAGVSLMTVSRALRGANGVSAATRDRVASIAKKHNYTTNMLVRDIWTGLTWTAGGVNIVRVFRHHGVGGPLVVDSTEATRLPASALYPNAIPLHRTLRLQGIRTALH